MRFLLRSSTYLTLFSTLTKPPWVLILIDPWPLLDVICELQPESKTHISLTIYQLIQTQSFWEYKFLYNNSSFTLNLILQFPLLSITIFLYISFLLQNQQVSFDLEIDLLLPFPWDPFWVLAFGLPCLLVYNITNSPFLVSFNLANSLSLAFSEDTTSYKDNILFPYIRVKWV